LLPVVEVGGAPWTVDARGLVGSPAVDLAAAGSQPWTTEVRGLATPDALIVHFGETPWTPATRGLIA
jgi:hypothetical protein